MSEPSYHDEVCHCGLGMEDHYHGGPAEHDFVPMTAVPPASDAAAKIRDLSGDVADCLSGGLPHDTSGYRGSLLHELLDAALLVCRENAALRAKWAELVKAATPLLAILRHKHISPPMNPGVQDKLEAALASALRTERT